MANNYQERDELLRQLGFASYEQYLKSDLWQFARHQLLRSEYAKPYTSCRVCGEKGNLVAHHMDYSMPTLVGNVLKDIEQLVLLCHNCHAVVEFDEHGKVPFYVANTRYERLLMGTPANELPSAATLANEQRRSELDDYAEFSSIPEDYRQQNPEED